MLGQWRSESFNIKVHDVFYSPWTKKFVAVTSQDATELVPCACVINMNANNKISVLCEC